MTEIASPLVSTGNVSLLLNRAEYYRPPMTGAFGRSAATKVAVWKRPLVWVLVAVSVASIVGVFWYQSTRCAIMITGGERFDIEVKRTSKDPVFYRLLLSPVQAGNALALGSLEFRVHDDVRTVKARWNPGVNLVNGSAAADYCYRPLDSCDLRANISQDGSLRGGNLTFELGFEKGWSPASSWNLWVLVKFDPYCDSIGIGGRDFA